MSSGEEYESVIISSSSSSENEMQDDDEEGLNHRFSRSSMIKEDISTQEPVKPSLFAAYNPNKVSQTSIPTWNASEVNSEPSSGLFPAYNLCEPKKTVEQTTSQAQSFDWLTNTSFKTPVVESKPIVEPSVSKDNNTTKSEKLDKKVKKPKKRKHKRKRDSDNEEIKPIKLKDNEDKQDDSLYGQLSKMVFIEETGLASERAYRLDPKPDRENFQFDSFYKVHIAKYYRNPLVPLGAPREFENDLLLLEKRSKKFLKKDKDARYFSKKNVSRNISKTPVPVVPMKELRVNEDASYISIKQSFSDSISLKSHSDINALGVYDAATTSYLAGVGKEALNADPTLQEQKRETEFYKRTQTFNEALRENPGDEDLWMEFVAFQDELATSNPYESDQISNSTNINKALLEKKLAILDRALANNPRMLKLAVQRMEICSQVMPRTQVLAEWKKLTFVQAGNPDVWLHYIEFLKSNLTSFTVTSIVKAYVKAISTLNSILQGTFHTLTIDPKLEENLLGLFANYCWFLRENGLTERSVATYQALIEFNLFEPTLPPETTFNERVTFFEPFWDSGMARVGEEGAQGWAQVFAQKSFSECHTVGFADLNEKEDEIMENEASCVEYWLEFENLRERHHWLPWRPKEGTDEECEDPERMVTLEDVSPVLFQLHSEKAKVSLILRFLRFLGVNVNIEKQELTPFSFSKSLEDKLFNEVVNLSNETKLESLLPFVNRLLEQVKPKFPFVTQRELDKVYLTFCVKETLSNCKTKKEFNTQIKNLKKITRNILKEENNRNDLYLWTIYARLEYTSGKIKDTFNAFSTIFASHCGISPANRELFLFTIQALETVTGLNNDLDKISVSDENQTKFRQYLTVLGAGDKFLVEDYEKQPEIPVTLLLKAKNGYKNLLKEREQSCEAKQTDWEVLFGERVSEYALCLSCYLYFLYFTYGLQQSLEPLDTIISSKLTENGFKINQTDMEYLNKCRINLLNMGSVSLTLLRPALQHALEINPEDITHLTSFIKIEGASYLSRQLRRFFAGLLNSKSKNSTILWIYAIISEWRRISNHYSTNNGENVEIPQIGVSWKIRNLFERALNIPSVTSCPLLWRMYMKFEVDQGCRDKAKAIFYRSLQKCPGHKILYLDAAKYFPDIIEEISDLLTEKEIRVRTPLEEIQLLIEHKNINNKSDDANAETTEENLL